MAWSSSGELTRGLRLGTGTKRRSCTCNPLSNWHHQTLRAPSCRSEVAYATNYSSCGREATNLVASSFSSRSMNPRTATSIWPAQWRWQLHLAALRKQPNKPSEAIAARFNLKNVPGQASKGRRVPCRRWQHRHKCRIYQPVSRRHGHSVPQGDLCCPQTAFARHQPPLATSCLV